MSRITATAVIVLSLILNARLSVYGETAKSEAFGYFKLPIVANSDNYLGLTMQRDAIFSGKVSGSIGTAGFAVVVGGATSPNWNSNQFVYSSPTQREIYFVEFTSGALKGLYYKITANTANSVTLDMAGDSLTLHPMVGNSTAALAVEDGFVVRPYWRIKDLFESAPSTPVIEARPDSSTLKDEILILDYTTIGTNKPYKHVVYFLSGAGWRADGQGSTDFADYVIEPNDAFVVRRRNLQEFYLVNKGWVQPSRGITFVPGGNGTVMNDTHLTLGRPIKVKLSEAGLRITDQTLSVIKDSTAPFANGDTVYTWSPGSGFNRPPNITYFYLVNQGWRRTGSSSTTVGDDFIQPGQTMVIRKRAANPGRDWVYDPNY